MSAYATTKKVLTSLHGKLIGLSQDKKLVAFGKTALLQDDQGVFLQLQNGTVAINATATLTIANILTKLVTSTTAAAVVATLPTGTLVDAGFSGDNALAVNESFDWTVINTGANTFTLSAGATHTIVGNAVVAATSSGTFRTRKTAANTFVTYRIA
jgi:hypothetical protein